MRIFVAIAILAAVGFVLMWRNFVERPTSNNSGPHRLVGGRQEWHAKWPPENERFSHLLRKWWEL
jgi:hypothetical protein